ncbi:MAG TPA: hypothetical protein VF215_15550 [Thermoanaerobaculia bacterium]|jgi:hypothetical protein
MKRCGHRLGDAVSLAKSARKSDVLRSDVPFAVKESLVVELYAR